MKYASFLKHITGLAAATSIALLAAGPSLAADQTITSQPWATYDYKEKPVRGGYYRTATATYIGKMNPNLWPVLDWISITYMYDRLFINDGEYKPSVSWLAKSMTYESPTVAIMKLREGVAFHDGSPFNAHSLKYQFEWIQDKKNGAWTRGGLNPVKSIEVIDDYTLKWTLKFPWSGFEGMLATAAGYTLSMQALKKGDPPLAKHPVGTGPYIFEEAEPGNFLKMKRNPNWWFAKASGNPDMPYFDGYITYVIPEPATRLASLRAGKLDGLTLDPHQYPQVKNDRNLKVYKQNLHRLTALWMNTTRGVLQDRKLRKAISHAIDRKALIAGVQFGLGREASAMYPDDHWGHNPNLKPVAYDPALAKKLLADAGYADGLKISGHMYNTPQSTKLGAAIKGMLAKVGIDWEVDFLPPADATARRKKGDFDLTGGGWLYILDPDRLAHGTYHPKGGFNDGRSNNPEIIKLVEAGRKETDFKKRQQIYWKLEETVYNDYQDVHLWWGVQAIAFREKVMGWDNDAYNKHKVSWWNSHQLWFNDGKQ